MKVDNAFALTPAAIMSDANVWRQAYGVMRSSFLAGVHSGRRRSASRTRPQDGNSRFAIAAW
jgi:hypothetical protein